MEILVLVILFASAVTGFFLGRPRKQELGGLIFGLILGPIGVGIVWHLGKKADEARAQQVAATPKGPAHRPHCPHCGGVVSKKAKACRHCGKEIAR